MNNQRIAITRVMEPVVSAAYAVMTVGGMTDDTRVYGFRLANGPSTQPGRGSAEPRGRPVKLKIAQRTGECLTVDIPAGPFSAWCLQLTPNFDPAAGWIANRPRIDWAYPSRAEAGSEVFLVGRGFVQAGQYPARDPRRPVSFGGLLKGRTHVVARKAGTAKYIAIPVARSSAYEVHLQLPKKMAAGDYEFSAHNGIGGAGGWSEPLRLPVAAAAPWPKKVFAVDRYGSDGRSADDAIAAALADLAQNGGGILQFSARAYGITRPIVLPRRTVLRGAGHRRTLISLPGGEGPKPPYVAITGDGDFVVEDVRIRAVHAPTLIAAPRFTPDTFDAAGDPERPIGLGEARARNVTVRRCYLEQTILASADRRGDQEHIRRMQDYAVGRPNNLPAVQFQNVLIKGDDLAFLDNTMYGGGSCLILSRCTSVRVAGNTLKAGASGAGLVAHSKLTWPPDFPTGGGARIHGNYCHELLVTDNEVTAYSERARNLVCFNYGGENIHVARNHIHDIPPNSDAEALLTHLWQARWPKPAIRMVGPVSAEIVDPEGTVAHECLDGAALDVVEGRGIGQVRRILRREGNRIELDRPWLAEPDATSRIVFTAPPPYANLNFIDNRILSRSVNIIIWGMSYDTVLDGNYVADGPGITIWSVRLEADQAVWGGAGFTQVLHNVADIGWSTPADAEHCVGATPGIFFVASKAYSCTAEGYDLLGLIVRDNHTTNNSGIGVPVTSSQYKPGGTRVAWRVHEAGIVIERNLCTDSAVGILVEKGARALVRRNKARNVKWPMVWAEPPKI